MSTEADMIIDGLGGTSAVAKMMSTPTSTVHSWRKNGIPLSRLAHLRLVVKADGLRWPLDNAADAAPSPGNPSNLTAAQQSEAA
ncbi:carph-isopro domain-containing protein [Sphingobium sp. YR768]|uniref:carph-isopro domain-containing protein n=1 Tax=Sphingobium sp. YR768 TaxID=1884365 RepID=UPI0008B8815B|nr:hypothetical protein [Sphingobium sp. YR768]SEQ59872.1 hypothetical protein SAMN05518866_101471 [Sphingobium sp. YR768]